MFSDTARLARKSGTRDLVVVEPHLIGAKSTVAQDVEGGYKFG
jgi:hypothetical protein